MSSSLFIVSADGAQRQQLQAHFRAKFQVHAATRAEDAWALFSGLLPDVVIIDGDLPERGGVHLLERIRQEDGDVAVVFMTPHGDVEMAVQATKAGADNCLNKPVDTDVMGTIVDRAEKDASLRKSYSALRGRFRNIPGVPEGENLVLNERISTQVQIATQHQSATVLITGPTGSGKGCIAELIHHESERNEGPFVDINCAGLSDSLLESELFGHERGAFTDAKNLKRGLMEVANGGTLFLDEIGEITPPIQAKLLKVIEDKSFRRVGGTTNIEVDVRIIAATNLDLQQLVTIGMFRRDLYYRLNVLPIELPSLTERREDIPKLVMVFLQEHVNKLNKAANIISDEAMTALTNYSWPGNIRELRNVVDRAAILCNEDGITMRDLPHEVQASIARSADEEEGLMSLREAERRLIMRSLAHTQYNKAAAARILGISVKTLGRKLKQYEHES
jgi:DNA-binding NtrC family response regulator